MTDTEIEFSFKQQRNIPLNLTLTCQAGAIHALVGPSGSGKTTLLRSIAGLYQPEQGFIRCQGQIWHDHSKQIYIPANQRAVGLVFQDYALFPHLTALGNVMAALNHLPKSQHRDKAKYWLTKVHLNGLENRLPNALSGGQQQRVAVARALAREPRVLLLDEPFSAVDQVTRRRLYRELLELRRSLSIPIIVVTHDLDEAALLADHMTLLYHGQSLQTGTPYQLTTAPVSVQVARLMDQQNLFTGSIVKHEIKPDTTIINWCGMSMEAKLQAAYPPNTKICWMIRPANVLLHRRDRPSKGEMENPVFGLISEYRILGEQVHLVIKLDFQPNLNLTMSVPLHVAKRNNLSEGETVGVSLLAQGIHIMPYEKLRSGVQNSEND